MMFEKADCVDCVHLSSVMGGGGDCGFSPHSIPVCMAKTKKDVSVTIGKGIPRWCPGFKFKSKKKCKTCKQEIE